MCVCVFCHSELVELGHGSKDTGRQLFAGVDSKPAIVFPPVITAQWEEQVLSKSLQYIPLFFLVLY